MLSEFTAILRELQNLFPICNEDVMEGGICSPNQESCLGCQCFIIIDGSALSGQMKGVAIRIIKLN